MFNWDNRYKILLENWGSELERLGVAGKTLLKKSLTPKQLANDIKSVLAKPSLSERAKLIGGMLKKENGLENALKLIEEKIDKISEKGQKGDKS